MNEKMIFMQNITFAELIFMMTLFSCFLLYFNFFINYSWNQKQLQLIPRKDNLSMISFSLWGALVSFFTLACVFTSGKETGFTISVVLLLFSVIMARYFYFRSISRLLAVKPVDSYYLYLIIPYGIISIYFLYMALTKGHSSIFNTDSPSNSVSVLRNILIPFEIKKEIKLLFLPNYIFCQLGFLYFIYQSFKKNEYLITIGSFFTMIAILYTNSYQVLNLTYWFPINVITDVFELFRLNQVQKHQIEKKITQNEKMLNELQLKSVEYDTYSLEQKVFKHDLANKFLSSYFNLKKLSKLIDQNNVKEEIKKSLESAIVAQEMASSYFKDQNGLSYIDLQYLADNLSELFNIKVVVDENSLKNLNTDMRDINNILVNLVKNAKEANEDFENPWVILNVQENDTHYFFEVIDCGEFSKIKDISKIFNSDFTTKGGTERGIGLYSVKRTIEKYKGAISIISKNKKTCFQFSMMKP